MKILMISSCPICPTNQGNRIRIRNLVNVIREAGCEVDFLHFVKEEFNIEEERAFIGKEHFFAEKFSFNTRLSTQLRRGLKKLTDRQKYFYINDDIDDYCSKKMVDMVKQLDEKNNYDIIWVEYIFLSRVLESFGKNKFKVIDTHDLFADRYKKYLDDGKTYRWFSVSYEGERKALLRADKVIAIQEEEAKVFKSMTGKTVGVVTIGHHLDLNPLVLNYNKKILYLASENPLNYFAINQFIQNVFPIIKKEINGIELILAGSICNGLNIKDSQIVKMGYIERIKDAYQLADVVINPIRFGTGLKIKCVEAFGFRRVLVTTSHGGLGLCSKENTQFIQADSTNDFASAIIRVIKDQELLEKIADNAYNYAIEINKTISEQIIKLVGEGRHEVNGHLCS